MKTSAWRRKLLMLLATAVVFASLGGCQKYQEEKRSGLLNDTVRFYTSAIRWSDFPAAASALRPRESTAEPVDLARLQGIRVMSNDYRINAVSSDSLEAEMVAVFTYQLPNSASVKTTTQSVTWWFDEEAQSWFIDGSLPKF